MWDIQNYKYKSFNNFSCLNPTKEKKYAMSIAHLVGFFTKLNKLVRGPYNTCEQILMNTFTNLISNYHMF